MNYINEMDTLVCRLEVLPRTGDEASLQQYLDGCRSCGGRAQGSLLHGFGQFPLIQCLARCLHRSQQCALSESLRGPGLLLQGFNICDVLELPIGKCYGKDLLRRSLLSTASRFSSPSFRPDIEYL